jgi:lysophospholipase L1-like esterase
MAHRNQAARPSLIVRLRRLFTRAKETDLPALPPSSGSTSSHGFGAGDAFEAKLVSSKSTEIARLNRRHSNGPSRFGPFAGIGSAISDALASLGRILIPTDAHRKEIGALMVIVLVAGALSASLPNVWAAHPDTSPSVSDMAFVEEPSEYVAPIDESPDPSAGTSAVASRAPAASPAAATRPVVKAPTPYTVYKFVALGDSLTAWPADNPWPNRLDAMDGHLSLAFNAGVPGDTTYGMWTRMYRDVFAYNPGVLFVMGGTNDLGHGVAISSIIANLKNIVVMAKQRSIKVFLMLVPPSSWSSEATSFDALNGAIVNLANSLSVVWIDVHNPLSNGGVFQDRYTSDGVHFTALGAQTVASLVYARIKGSGY